MQYFQLSCVESGFSRVPLWSMTKLKRLSYKVPGVFTVAVALQKVPSGGKSWMKGILAWFWSFIYPSIHFVVLLFHQILSSAYSSSLCQDLCSQGESETKFKNSRKLPSGGKQMQSIIIDYYYRVILLASMGAYGGKHNGAGGLGKASRILKLGFEGRLAIFWANKL